MQKIQFRHKAWGWLLNPANWWLRHLLFWVFRYNEIIIGKLVVEGDIGFRPIEFLRINLIPDLLLVYLNLNLLMPRYLLQRRISAYIGRCLLVVVAFAGWTFWQAPLYDESEPLGLRLNSFVQDDLHDGLVMMGLTTGLRIVLEWFYDQYQLKELRTANLQTELAYLKSQVNPHFLFNTLNNISVLSEVRPQEVAPAILQLSSVLRYQLYEGQRTKVPLNLEMENLQNYLALESGRINDPRIVIKSEGELATSLVEPLLFLPFVENALKHGAHPDGKIEISILFKVEPGQIEFFIENSKPDVPPAHLDGGIGLKNTQRRLELLYPGQHELRITDEKRAYKVWLTLQTE